MASSLRRAPIAYAHTPHVHSRLLALHIHNTLIQSIVSVAMSFGCAMWVCRVPVSFGCVVWLYRMVVSFGCVVWLCRLANWLIQSGVCGCVLWLCDVPVSLCCVVGLCRLVVSFSCVSASYL